MFPTRQDLQSPRLRPAVARVLGEVCERLLSEEASLWCVSANGTHMDLAVNHGGEQALLECLSVPVSESVVGLVQATGMATAIGPGDAHHPGVDAATGGTTMAMVAAPVPGPEGLLGVLSAINPRHGGRFSGEDLARLSDAARRLGALLIGDDSRAG